ncbi:TetR/AcrR family transcriptional regulator [Bacillus wiedmannii]|uniref:TetR/AcrR family transcriptional regulator n=1 Tax=Bacillus wiedmannii TaxID=1890302 RepID=UPI003CEB15AD
MKKNDEVREQIIRTALQLFNTKGFSQTSIQDIMEAASLPKGAIYRRFTNKEAIALATLEKAGKIIEEHIVQAVKKVNTATDKLLAMAYIYQDAVNSPPIEGGCPLLNTAIEADNSYPELQKAASEAYNQTLVFVQSIIEDGIRNNEFRKDIDSFSLASFLISSMEGAIMTSRLLFNNDHIFYCIEQIKALLHSYSS